MRYDWKFKLECIEMHKNGKWAHTPQGLNDARFHRMICEWVRIFEKHGIDGLKHSGVNKNWTPDQRYELVAKVLVGNSITSVAIEAGIQVGQLYQWVKKYKQFGIDGLQCKQGRPTEEPIMKNKEIKLELTPSEKEKMILMEKRIQYLETENEYLKKSIALRQKEKAELLKAKKHKSSKNSEKKD